MKNDLNVTIKSIKYSRVIIIIVVTIFSIYAAYACYTSSTLYSSYESLYILPLVHGLFSVIFIIICFKGDFYLDIPVLVIYFAFFFRNVITPLAMANGQSISMIGYPTSSGARMAIILLLYETFMVLLTIAILKRKRRIKFTQHITRIRVFHPSNEKFVVMLIIFVSISLLSLLLLPELRSQYYSLFTKDITHLVQNEISYTSGLKRMLGSAGELVIEATRLILCTLIFCKIREKNGSSLSFCVCLIIIGLQLFFMTDSNAYLLILVLTLFLVLSKLFPKYGQKALIGLVAAGIGFVAVLWINRFALDHYGTSISIFLQAYFPGVANCAGILKLFPRTGWEAFSQFFIDMYATVPFRSTLFGYSGGLVDVCTRWNIANGVTGQILPTIAESYYYFGAILSPILSCIITAISIKSFEKAQDEVNPLKYAVLVFVSLYAAASICMYDWYIFCNGITNRVLFMIILAWLSNYSVKDIINRGGL